MTAQIELRRKLLVIATAVALICLTLDVRADDFKKAAQPNSWHPQELPTSGSNTLTYVLVGAAVAALVVGIIVKANAGKNTTMSAKSDSLHIEAVPDSLEDHTSIMELDRDLASHGLVRTGAIRPVAATTWKDSIDALVLREAIEIP